MTVINIRGATMGSIGGYVFTTLVLKQPNSDIPVYVVQRENGTGPKRTLHRNLLLPIQYKSRLPS